MKKVVYSVDMDRLKKAYYNYEKAEKDLHKAKVELWKELVIAKGDYRKMLELREWTLKEIIDDSCD